MSRCVLETGHGWDSHIHIPFRFPCFPSAANSHWKLFSVCFVDALLTRPSLPTKSYLLQAARGLGGSFSHTNLISQIHWSPLPAPGRRWPPPCCGNILPPAAMWPPCQILPQTDSRSHRDHRLLAVVPIKLSVTHGGTVSYVSGRYEINAQSQSARRRIECMDFFLQKIITLHVLEAIWSSGSGVQSEKEQRVSPTAEVTPCSWAQRCEDSCFGPDFSPPQFMIFLTVVVDRMLLLRR